MDTIGIVGCGFIGLIFLTLLGLFVVNFALSRGECRAHHVLHKVAATPIDQVKDGQTAKVVGLVQLVEPALVSPLTGRPCAFYRAEVTQEEVRMDSHLRSWWTVLESVKMAQHFAIEDATGRALVDMERPMIFLAAQYCVGVSPKLPRTKEMRALRAAHGVASGDTATQNERYTEASLREQIEVAVYGVCHWEPDPDPQPRGGGYRTAGRRLRISAPRSGEVLISGEPEARGVPAEYRGWA